jgi:hypothetical protein
MKRIIGRALSIPAAACLLGVAAGAAGGAVMASGPVSSGVIHGCYATYSTKESHGSHQLMLQDTGTACPAGTTAISWNQQGPQGPEGPPGPAGPGAAVDKGAFTCQGAKDPSTGDVSISCTTDSMAGPDKITITPTPPSGLTLSGFPPDTSIELFDAGQGSSCESHPPARQLTAGESYDDGASWQFTLNFVCLSGGPFPSSAISTFWYAAIPG